MSEFEDEDRSRNLLSKADEFLRRRRGPSAIAASPPFPPADDDDIPVLTEVVDETLLLTTARPEDFSAAIAREMDAWLDENLPQVVLHALDGITDKLIAQIHESARSDLLPRLQRELHDRTKPE